MLRTVCGVVLLLFTVDAKTCMPSALPGYSCELSVGTSAAVHWRRVGTTVRFALAAECDGYVSLGFGQRMVGSEAVLGYATPGGEATSIAVYRLDGTSSEEVVPIEVPWLVQDSAKLIQQGGTTILEFERRGVSALDTTMSVIVAYHARARRAAYHGNTRSVESLDISVVEDVDGDTESPVEASSQPAVLCTPSTLLTKAGVLYQCAKGFNNDVTLHWTLGSRTEFAVQSVHSGYLAIGFVSNKGSMVCVLVFVVVFEFYENIS